MNIKNKKNVNIEKTNSSFNGFIIINIKKLPINNKKKILLNNTLFLLNKEKFHVVNRKIRNIEKYLADKFKINNIYNSKLLYGKNNVNIFAILIDKRDDLKMHEYEWRKYIDFYEYNDDLELYFEIVNYRLNSHLGNKIYGDKYLTKSYLKLDKIYKYLVNI